MNDEKLKFIEESTPIRIGKYKFYKRELEHGICDFDEKESEQIVKGLGICANHLVEMWEMDD